MNFPIKKAGWLYLALFVFPFIAYWQIGLMQHVMKWDMLDQFFPYRYFLSECFKNGALPSWNPYQLLGWPFHADPQSGFWYPVAWLLAIGRGYDIYTMNFEFILHIIIGGAGFFILLRGLKVENKVALLFSFAYQCCGIFVNNAQHLTWIVAMAWLPWVFHHYLMLYRDEGRGTRDGVDSGIYHAAAAGLFMMLMLTGGYPVFTIITNYFFAAVFIIHVFRAFLNKERQPMKKIFGFHVIMYGVFSLLASGYLISFWEAMPFISRGEPLSLEKALEGALPVKALVSLMLPFAVTKNDGFFSTDLSMLNVYMGLLPLLFMLASIFYFKNSVIRLFLIFGTICLAAALGDLLPVRTFLYHYFPLMDSFRFPSIFRAFFVFSFLIAGAVAASEMLRNSSVMRMPLFLASLLLAFGVIAFHFYVLDKAEHFVKFPNLFNVNSYLDFFNKSTVYQRIAIQSLAQFSILALAVVFFFFIKQPKKLIAALLSLSVADFLLSVQFNLPATAISEVKARHFQRQLDDMPQGFPVPVLQPLNEVKSYDERLYPSWHNQNILLKKIGPHGFNSFYLRDYMTFYDSPQRDLVLKNPVAFVQPGSGEDEIYLKNFTPNEFTFQVSAERETQLTLMQSRYPGWRISVDGKDAKAASVAIPFLAVNLPPGNHEVRFKYASAYLKPAMAVSFLAFGIVFFFLVFKTFWRSD